MTFNCILYIKVSTFDWENQLRKFLFWNFAPEEEIILSIPGAINLVISFEIMQNQNYFQ